MSLIYKTLFHLSCFVLKVFIAICFLSSLSLCWWFQIISYRYYNNKKDIHTRKTKSPKKQSKIITKKKKRNNLTCYKLTISFKLFRLANMRTNGFERKRCTSRYYRLATCLHHANVRTLNSSSQEYKG